MKASRRVAAIAAMALVAGCSQAPRVDGAAEANVIRGLSKAWLAADEARDVEKAVSFYADDAVELASNTPLVVGKAAIREWYLGWLPHPDLSLTFATESVDVAPAGDVAWERGTYEFTTLSASRKSVDKGKYLTVWKKVGGAWKVAADMANSDMPVPG